MHDALIYIPIGFGIACVIALLYLWYRTQFKQKDEVYFVMFGEPDCCNPFRKPASTTDCRKYCRGKLLMHLEQQIVWANSSICIAMFNFNNSELRSYILRAKRQRGVQIRIIVDKSISKKGDNRQAKELINAGKISLLRKIQLKY